MKRLLFSIAILTLLLLPVTGWGETYYASPSGTGSGTSCADSDSFVDVISSSRTTDGNHIIYLCAGTYELGADVLFADGDNGDSIVMQAASGLTASDVVLDGADTYSFRFTRSGDDLTVQDITFQNFVSDAVNHSCSIQFYAGQHLIITDCVFSSNDGDGDVNGSPVAVRNLVSGNVNVTGTIFLSNNNDDGAGAGTGGAIRVAAISGDTTISGCSFTSNTAGSSAGALYVLATGTNILSDCIFTSNSNVGTNDNNRQGGAVMYSGSITGTVSDCVFTSNDAGIYHVVGAKNSAGGALKFSGGASGTVERCTFVSNTACMGGAIDQGGNSGVTTTIRNCKFITNTATDESTDASEDGGAINVINNNSVNDYNNTYYGNTADDDGDAVCSNSTGTITCTNSVYDGGDGSWGNTSDLINAIAGSTLNVTHCNIEGGADSVTNEDTYSSNINNTPLFINPANGDFSLQWNSPCIDAGYDVSATIPTDFRNWPRKSDSGVDIGAYEGKKMVVLPGSFPGRNIATCPLWWP